MHSVSPTSALTIHENFHLESSTLTTRSNLDPSHTVGNQELLHSTSSGVSGTKRTDLEEQGFKHCRADANVTNGLVPPVCAAETWRTLQDSSYYFRLPSISEKWPKY